LPALAGPVISVMDKLSILAHAPDSSAPRSPQPVAATRRALRRYARHVPVDVLCEIDIDRPRAETAAYASDPDHATDWYENIKAVDWKTPRPVSVGSKISFVANFLGRRLAYTYEVTELVAGERFTMRTAEGPFPMETTYTWQDTPGGGTRMAIRNRGEPAGFARVGAPVMTAAMRRANTKDLRRLKQILERSAAGAG
jgi:Polyketide cyclase / dehydrase and lipid transport